ncbi:hypothetical protein JOJ87_001401 [Rhodococcus ruber]|uniref:hypothetical protein n=1 Tax=Rhodococcus ruber TaxID=1830 RepID=UPI001AE6F09D|nr:hypothetical protein [Rhodococcus ruber]MBP2211057.1 hypothetical protein [Rhodococcus ruber]
MPRSAVHLCTVLVVGLALVLARMVYPPVGEDFEYFAAGYLAVYLIAEARHRTTRART